MTLPLYKIPGGGVHDWFFGGEGQILRGYTSDALYPTYDLMFDGGGGIGPGNWAMKSIELNEAQKHSKGGKGVRFATDLYGLPYSLRWKSATIQFASWLNLGIGFSELFKTGSAWSFKFQVQDRNPIEVTFDGTEKSTEYQAQIDDGSGATAGQDTFEGYVDVSIVPGTVSVRKNGNGTPGSGTEIATDDGNGGITHGTNDVTGTIDYATGAITIEEGATGGGLWGVGDSVDVDYEKSTINEAFDNIKTKIDAAITAADQDDIAECAILKYDGGNDSFGAIPGGWEHVLIVRSRLEGKGSKISVLAPTVQPINSRREFYDVFRIGKRSEHDRDDNDATVVPIELKKETPVSGLHNMWWWNDKYWLYRARYMNISVHESIKHAKIDVDVSNSYWQREAQERADVLLNDVSAATAFFILNDTSTKDSFDGGPADYTFTLPTYDNAEQIVFGLDVDGDGTPGADVVIDISGTSSAGEIMDKIGQAVGGHLDFEFIYSFLDEPEGEPAVWLGIFTQATPGSGGNYFITTDVPGSAGLSIFGFFGGDEASSNVDSQGRLIGQANPEFIDMSLAQDDSYATEYRSDGKKVTEGGKLMFFVHSSGDPTHEYSKRQIGLRPGDRILLPTGDADEGTYPVEKIFYQDTDGQTPGDGGLTSNQFCKIQVRSEDGNKAAWISEDASDVQYHIDLQDKTIRYFGAPIDDQAYWQQHAVSSGCNIMGGGKKYGHVGVSPNVTVIPLRGHLDNPAVGEALRDMVYDAKLDVLYGYPGPVWTAGIDLQDLQDNGLLFVSYPDEFLRDLWGKYVTCGEYLMNANGVFDFRNPPTDYVAAKHFIYGALPWWASTGYNIDVLGPSGPPVWGFFGEAPAAYYVEGGNFNLDFSSTSWSAAPAELMDGQQWDAQAGFEDKSEKGVPSYHSSWGGPSSAMSYVSGVACLVLSILKKAKWLSRGERVRAAIDCIKKGGDSFASLGQAELYGSLVPDAVYLNAKGAVREALLKVASKDDATTGDETTDNG